MLGIVIIWRLAHSCVWWLVRPLLGQTARTPTCGLSMWLLGFLTRWWLVSKDEHPKRERETARWKKHFLPFLTLFECHLLLIREITKFRPVSRGTEGLHWLMGEWQGSRKAYGTGNMSQPFLGKSIVPQLIYIQLFNRTWHTGSWWYLKFKLFLQSEIVGSHRAEIL